MDGEALPSVQENLKSHLGTVNHAIFEAYRESVQYSRRAPLAAQEHDGVADIIALALKKCAEYSDAEVEHAIYMMNDLGPLRSDDALSESYSLDERLIDALVRLAVVEYCDVFVERNPGQNIDAAWRSGVEMTLFRKLSTVPFRSKRGSEPATQTVSDAIARLHVLLGLPHTQDRK